MKKIRPALFIAAFLSTTSFAEPAANPGFDISPSGTATVSAVQTLPESVSIDKDMEITAQTQHEENAELAYKIDVVYPQITGTPLSPAAKKFNQLVLDMTTKDVEQFKNYVKADMHHMQTLSDAEKHNTLHIDYGIDVIKPVNQTLISVRLSIEGMQAGRAHPYHRHQVLNFDLAQGKVLALKNLFKPNANYLNVLAKYASKSLNDKLQDKWMINEGSAPLAKNYQIWNLEDDGFLITFEEYQVAPYSYGVQEVRVPYEALKPLIAANSPIASCVKNAAGCTEEA